MSLYSSTFPPIAPLLICNFWGLKFAGVGVYGKKIYIFGEDDNGDGDTYGGDGDSRDDESNDDDDVMISVRWMTNNDYYDNYL